MQESLFCLMTEKNQGWKRRDIVNHFNRKAEPMEKIRVVETMDMINNDIVELAEDNYIGKYQNTYSNKCLLLSAIKTYMDEILVNGLIEDYSIEFDVEKIRKYVIENEKIKRRCRSHVR